MGRVPDIPYLPLSLFSYLLVISGSVTMFLGFFGSFGALKEVKCMLAIYFILLTVLLAAHIIGTVLLFTQRSAFENSLDNRVKGVIKSFGKNDSSPQHILQSLQFLQSEAHCCGWISPEDWGRTFLCSKHGESCFYRNSTVNTTVIATVNATTGSSDTCFCKDNYPTYCTVYKENCKGIVKKWLDEHLTIILSVVLAVAVVEPVSQLYSDFPHWVQSQELVYGGQLQVGCLAQGTPSF
ncbi:leukocyte antigen CD37-like, partial [Clarias magur]